MKTVDNFINPGPINAGTVSQSLTCDLGSVIKDRFDSAKRGQTLCINNLRSALNYDRTRIPQEVAGNEDQLTIDTYFDLRNVDWNNGYKSFLKNVDASQDFRICVKLRKKGKDFNANELLVRFHVKAMSIVEFIDSNHTIEKITITAKQNTKEEE